MRINNHQQNFCAKWTLSGHTNDISNELKEFWTNRIKTVGTDNDSILLHIGKPEEKTIKKNFMGVIPIVKKVKDRFIYVSATMNKKITEKDLSYQNKSLFFDEQDYMKNKTDIFFKQLES